MSLSYVQLYAYEMGGGGALCPKLIFQTSNSGDVGLRCVCFSHTPNL